MISYFLICASRHHVLEGMKAGIAQAGHGKKDYMSRLSKGDWIIFYSSPVGAKLLLRAFCM